MTLAPRRTARLPVATLLALAGVVACPSVGAVTPPATVGTDTRPAAVPACPAGASAMDGWDDRAPPRRIYGNTWYVGTCGLSAVLVTSDRGHVLIDGGTEAAGPLIAANIRALGFDPAQVKYLLNSHEHHDHAAGLAYLQQVTGAPLLARAPAVAALRRGRGDRSDPQQLEPHSAFPGVARVEVIADGATVRVGPLALTAHATPGHTPGGTSWTWRACEDGRCHEMAYTDSVSALSDAYYRYRDHPAAIAAFEAGLATLAALPCDIQITPHPLGSHLFARLDGAPGTPLVQPQACRRYAAQGRANLARRLAEEDAAPPR